MKIKNITGLLDEQNVLSKLTALAYPLILINEHIDFSLFQELILKFTGRSTETTQPNKADQLMML